MYEMDVMSHLGDLYKQSRYTSHTYIGCSKTLADRWRSESWFPGQGVPIEVVTMPHPLEQFKLARLTDIPRDLSHGLVYIMENDPDSNPLTSRRPHRPFVGAITRERKDIHGCAHGGEK
uniref:Mononeg_mRNAcap domain-containing protein n=1 Tax=Trichuris muris TaxID=70415 RepID=A0A5S6QXW5_TRIMR